MSLTYRQEEDGEKHILQFKNEKWTYTARQIFDKAMEYLVDHNIEFSVSYSHECYHISIAHSLGSYSEFKQMLSAFNLLAKLKSEGVCAEKLK